tara:strand:+ start:645 stop:1667 length:1023 start_codon:yes stop_codon:yes gene_type:complete
MANEVKKVNNIAITDIKNINGQTDADIKKINTKEFTGLSAGTWSASGDSLNTARSNFFSAQGSTRDAMAIIGGNGTGGLSDRENSEEEYDGVNDTIGTGQTVGISGIMCGAGGATSAVVGGGTSSGSFVSGNSAFEFGSGSWSSIASPGKVYFQGSSSAGTSAGSVAFVGGTSSGDCDMNADYHMSWDQSSWTEETNFIGAVYGPAYAFGGGSAHDSYRITCGFYSTHPTSCSRGSLNKNYTYEGTTWSLSSDNAPAAGNGGVGGGTLNDHYHTIKNYSGSSTMQLYDGGAWSTGGTHSYPNGSSNQNTQVSSVNTAQFGGREGGSGYGNATNRISLYDR